MSRRSFLVSLSLGIPLVHVLLPWAISLLSLHLGWVGGFPGFWNLLGLVPVVLGMAGMLWCFAMHVIGASDSKDVAWEPPHLIMNGPYRFSRNPMYAAEIVLWLGWALLFGSLPVLIAAVLWAVMFNFFAVPYEERTLAERFGEGYREYQRAVPRWFRLPGR